MTHVFQKRQNAGTSALSPIATRTRIPAPSPHNAAPGPHWDFARTPITHTPQTGPRIDRGAITQSVLPATDAQSRDGSPDGTPQHPDQDALAPSLFEQKTRGIHIRVPGGSPAATTEYPGGIRWVQTIVTNKPLFGQTSPYVDFIPPKDAKPFYFADSQESATFSDSPSRSKNDVQWDATLSLVGVNDKTLTRLDSITYGFDIDPAGKVSPHAPSDADSGDIVTQGGALRSEYPTWTIDAGFPHSSGQLSLQAGVGAVHHFYTTPAGPHDALNELVLQGVGAYTRQFHGKNQSGLELQGYLQLQYSLSSKQFTLGAGTQAAYVFQLPHNLQASIWGQLSGGINTSTDGLQGSLAVGTQIQWQPKDWLAIGAQIGAGPTVQNTGPNSIDAGGGLFIQISH